MRRAPFFPGRFVIHPVTRAGLAALALTLSGCALTFDATDLGVPTSLAESARTPPQGTSFRITKHPVFLLWGLTAASRPNAEDLLAGQAGTGARIANLRIKVRSRWSDLLVTVLTAGLISPRSVTFEGVVVPAGGGGGGGKRPPAPGPVLVFPPPQTPPPPPSGPAHPPGPSPPPRQLP